MELRHLVLQHAHELPELIRDHAEARDLRWFSRAAQPLLEVLAVCVLEIDAHAERERIADQRDPECAMALGRMLHVAKAGGIDVDALAEQAVSGDARAQLPAVDFVRTMATAQAIG